MNKWCSMEELFETLTRDMSAADLKSAMVTSDISLAILNQRIGRGMTQKEFAEFLGVSQGMVSKWESGDYNFTISSIANIFEQLEIDFEFKIKERSSEINDNNFTNMSFKFECNPIKLCFDESLLYAS